MKAALLKKDKHESTGFYQVKVETVAKPTVSKGNLLIQLSAAALNHRDVWMTEGMYPGLQFDSILGADGAGIVIGHGGDQADAHWIGKRVLIDSSFNWGPDRSRPNRDYKILGLKPLPGTLAEYIVVPTEQVHEIPEHLDFVQAASIPLAGLTAYRSVFTKGEVSAGKIVLVTGIGGGVALFALQFAVAAGAKVFVTSSSNEKIQKAIKLGAAGGVNYTEDGWDKKLLKLTGGLIDVIVDGSGGDSLNTYGRLLNVGGIVALYGATAGSPNNFVLPYYFLKNAEIRGSAMGSPIEFREMMKLINSTKLIPVVSSVRPFEKVTEAFEEMRQGKQFGKLVISINNIKSNL